MTPETGTVGLAISGIARGPDEGATQPSTESADAAHARYARLADELETTRAAAARLAAELERERMERARLAREHARAERSNAELVGMCVAALHLHGTLEPAEVLAALQEVMINVLGSEEFALLEPRGPAGEPVATLAFGVNAEALAAAVERSAAIGRALRGEWHLAVAAADAGAAEEPVACIPLTLEGRSAGALVVFGLLPHRGPLDETDRRLLEMVAGAAPRALHAARLHAAHGAALLNRSLAG